MTIIDAIYAPLMHRGMNLTHVGCPLRVKSTCAGQAMSACNMTLTYEKQNASRRSPKFDLVLRSGGCLSLRFLRRASKPITPSLQEERLGAVELSLPPRVVAPVTSISSTARCCRRCHRKRLTGCWRWQEKLHTKRSYRDGLDQLDHHKQLFTSVAPERKCRNRQHRVDLQTQTRTN